MTGEDYNVIMTYHTPDLRRVYRQAADAGEVNPVAILMINNPWMLSYSRGCSVAKARKLIKQHRRRGKSLNAYRSLPYEDAAATLVRTCPKEWAEASIKLRECPGSFVAAVLEMDDYDKNKCIGGMLRLLPIDAPMTDVDKLDEPEEGGS
jgi:hypothetical protein